MAHGPEPGTILNESGVPTVPRQAATVIVLRGGGERLEVLLVQRTPKARFMGGAWVFPGGAVDAHEGEGDAAHRAAAIREVAEEIGITLPDPAALVPFARWITPPEVSIRFDTYFFLAVAPDDAEAVDRRVRDRRRALVRAGARARGLRGGRDPDGLPDDQEPRADRASSTPPTRCSRGRRQHEVKPVEPRVEGQGEAARIVIDDD